MKILRVLVVVHASLIPPETLEGHTAKEIEEWRTEYDVTSTLRTMGHEVRCVGVLDSLTELRTVISEWKPDVDCGSTNLIQYDHNPDFEQTHHTVIEELEPRCAPCHHKRHAKQEAAGVSQ